MAVAPILPAFASVTSTVLPAKCATCGVLLVVTPDPNMTMHRIFLCSVAVAAVNVNVAVAVPELVMPAVKSVVPQPSVIIFPMVVNVNKGSRSAIVSEASRGAFSSNVYEIAELDQVEGRLIASKLYNKTGDTTAVDVWNGTATISLVAANVTARVRVTSSASCVDDGVVMPLPIDTVH